MVIHKKTLKDINVKNKKILMRVDFNVPLKNGIIEDNKRIVSALDSICYIIDNGGSLLLMSHLGRPQGKVIEDYSLRPCAKELSKLLNKKVIMAPDSRGEKVKEIANSLQSSDIVLLENTRFYLEENSKVASDRKIYAKELASLGDIYINDAFGSAHREHASTANIAEYLPSAIGFLIEKELKFLGQSIQNPKKPLVAILGGAKIKDKIPVVEKLIKIADHILIGGGMSYTFLKSQGKEIGKSIVDESHINTCTNLLQKSPDIIHLPLDVKATSSFNFNQMKVLGEIDNYDIDQLPKNKEALDIGPKTIKLYSDIIMNAGTVLWNGPMGVFECPDTAIGTNSIAQILAEATTKNNVISIIGGGDSASAIKKINLENKMSHISTGGGASLAFLEGKPLPGIAFIDDK